MARTLYLLLQVVTVKVRVIQLMIQAVKKGNLVIQEALDFMSGARVTIPQLSILVYLLKIIRILKDSYELFAIIFEEYAEQ